MTRATAWITRLFNHEAASGVLLLCAAIAALALDNSPLAWAYDRLLQTRLAVSLDGFALDKPLLLWINDGLMAVFFFLVGLEIKRELLTGKLASWRNASLPLVAAVGGMVVPALLYTAVNFGDPEAMRGWAIPAATDIAFALAVLVLLGNRVPASLKVLLLAIAIIDDLGAILVIALFYTSELSLTSLLIAAGCAALLLSFNLSGVRRIAPYLLVGLVMWICVLKSGVHATLAGVVVALAIPLRGGEGNAASPLTRLEHALHPWVAFAVMPIFAFANAGVALAGFAVADLAQPVTLGILLGLVVGKQFGVFGFAYAAVKLRLCALPQDMTWRHVYGVALLTGIGFTMSLFIGTLAFAGPEQAAAVRIGVLAASTVSAVAGYAVLRYACPDERAAAGAKRIAAAGSSL